MILKCDCNNEYQDNKYGLNMRVFTPMKKGLGKCRCTICGKINTFSEKDEEKKKEKDIKIIFTETSKDKKKEKITKKMRNR